MLHTNIWSVAPQWQCTLHKYLAITASIFILLLIMLSPARGETPPMTTARESHTATLLVSGKVLVVGGWNSSDTVSTAELFDTVGNNWTSAGTMTAARYGHTATKLPNGKVLVAGGSNSNGPLATAELYDPADNSWSTAGSLTTARLLHSATLLDNGKVIVVGGINSSGTLSSVDQYDPVSNSWVAASEMSAERRYHTSTLLASGKVLVAGGLDSDGYALSDAELFDPAGNSWSAAGSLNTARGVHTATLLANGTVLVAGGYDSIGNELGSAELYSPASNIWLTAGSMSSGRQSHAATLLANGTVLVTGGALSLIAELYDPASNIWSEAGSLTASRYSHTATLLSNDKVLVAGGFDGSDALASAELYIASSVDTIPDQFTFTDLTGIAINTAVTSNSITVVGINAISPIRIVGGSYSINNGSYMTAAGTVKSGDTVTVRLVSSGSYSATTVATLTIGSMSDTFSVTTKDLPPPSEVPLDPAKVKIDDIATGYYSIHTILDAVTAPGNTVRARNLMFVEDVIMTNPASILLKGGYTDDTFSSRTDISTTVIDGSLKIRGGTLRVERLVVR